MLLLFILDVSALLVSVGVSPRVKTSKCLFYLFILFQPAARASFSSLKMKHRGELHIHADTHISLLIILIIYSMQLMDESFGGLCVCVYICRLNIIQVGCTLIICCNKNVI